MFGGTKFLIDNVPFRSSSGQYLRKRLPLVGVDQEITRQLHDAVAGSGMTALYGECSDPESVT